MLIALGNRKILDKLYNEIKIISISLFVVTQYLIIKQEYDIDENYNKQQKIEHFNNLRSFNMNSMPIVSTALLNFLMSFSPTDS